MRTHGTTIRLLPLFMVVIVMGLGGCIPGTPPDPILFLAISQPLDQFEANASSGDWATVPVDVTWNGELRPGSLIVSVTGPKGTNWPETTENITSALTVDTSGTVNHAKGSISLRGFTESRPGTFYTITAVADLYLPAQNGFVKFTANRDLRVYRTPISPPANMSCPPGSTDPRCL